MLCGPSTGDGTAPSLYFGAQFVRERPVHEHMDMKRRSRNAAQDHAPSFSLLSTTRLGLAGVERTRKSESRTPDSDSSYLEIVTTTNAYWRDSEPTFFSERRIFSFSSPFSCSRMTSCRTNYSCQTKYSSPESPKPDEQRDNFRFENEQVPSLLLW